MSEEDHGDVGIDCAATIARDDPDTATWLQHYGHVPPWEKPIPPCPTTGKWSGRETEWREGHERARQLLKRQWMGAGSILSDGDIPKATMNNYEERKAARIERTRALAAKRRAEGEARIAQSDRLADLIPLGQPILVGHHSERRHRRDIERIHGGLRRGFDALKEADALDRRADSAESSTAISSDDPEAIAKLREQIAAIERQKALSVLVNKAIRRVWREAAKDGRSDAERLAAGVVALGELGIDPARASTLLTPDYAGRIGVPSYRLNNAGAELRRLEQRIALIEQARTNDGRSESIGQVELRWEDNRVRLIYPGKPEPEVRTALKRSGFRWSPTSGAWQRQANELAWHEARRIANQFAPKTV